MTTRTPVPKPGILDIELYVPGESSVSGGRKPIKLSSNEAPLGASPRAITAYQQAAGDLERYPDGGARALRIAIGARYGLDPERIVCGAGSDELLSLLAHGYLGPGDEAIHTEHGFLVYPIAIRANGATPVVAREVALTTDVDAILACVTPCTKIVFIANPNNPTGTFVPTGEIERLRAGLPDDVMLVLDGAYAEYVLGEDFDAGVALIGRLENTVMTRTFSKIYGLAALRLGWAYAPASVVAVLNRLRGPFNVSEPAIAAGIAAIEDREHIAKARAHNDEWRPWLARELTELGLVVTPSLANFILVHFAHSGPWTAEAADGFLKEQGIIVRKVGAYGLPHALRITIGSEADNLAVVDALDEFMGQRAA